MKLFLSVILSLAFSLTTLASGKFMFMPEANYTKNESKLLMGVSIYEHLLGPVSWVNYTGMSLDKMHDSSIHHVHDFVVNNGLVTHLGEKLDLEFGHKYTFNKHDKYHENKGYVKVSAQLW